MLKTITFRRLLNYILLLFSYWVSAIGRTTKTVNIYGLPITLTIEPTTYCNLKCPECPSGLRKFTRPRGILQKSLFEQIVDELHKNLISIILYFQGEPYLNPSLFDFIEYASKKKIYTIISTNGHFLDEENAKKTIEAGLNRIIISIDGTTQETFSSYRVDGELSKVIDGIKNIIKWKLILKSSHPSVYLQFLVTKNNEHQIQDIKKLGEELGVYKVLIKTAQLFEYENGHPLMPTNEKYSRYKKSGDGKFPRLGGRASYVIKNKLRNSCWRMWSSSVGTWDGLIVPCCFDKDAKYILGDLKKDSFKTIWRSEKYKNFRKRIFLNRKAIDICNNCTEGTKVWV